MLNLEDKEWKECKFIDIFNIKNGFYNKKPDLEKEGNIPFIGAVDNSNGITEFYTLKNIDKSSKTGDKNNHSIDRKIFEKNAICVTNDGSVGYAYYQQSDFTCTHSVNPLYLKKYLLNKNLAMFLICSIEKQRVCFEYSRKWRPKRMIKSNILLPMNEKSEPDYEYMENYTKPIIDKKIEDYKKYAKNVLSKLEYKKIEPLENKEWKEFYLSGEKGIFTNYHGKRLIKEHRILGLTPLLTACENNNGISSFISNETMNKYKNCITIDMFGNSFYHNYFCSGDDNIYFFLNDDLCMFKKLFIVEMINKNKNKFSYGKQFRQKNADNFKILLPINEKNEPDYEYMEQYMKNITYKKIKQYLNYKDKEA